MLVEGILLKSTRAPLRGRLTPPATLAQGKEECNQKHVRGTERRRPTLWCKQRFDSAKSYFCRASCPVVLSCAVCFCYRCCVLIGSTGVICMGKKQGPVKDQIHIEEKRRKVAHHNNTYYTRYCPMSERKHTAQHDTAPQRRARQRTVRLRTAPHGATMRCWAINSRTDLS